MSETLWRVWNRARLYVGSWVLGGDWYGVVMRLWLIRDRAMVAIKQDGRVVLADCLPLAEVLYEPIPGQWSLHVEQLRASAARTPEKDSPVESSHGVGGQE